MNSSLIPDINPDINPDISKDTTLCISLSARPGNFGTRFHNYLYRELGLNFLYKAFSTHDLPAAIKGIQALGIRGSAISMPFKEQCIEFLDELDQSARGIWSVNTIVNNDGKLKGYNTDYGAVFKLMNAAQLPLETRFTLLGSGGMAKAVLCALRDLGFRNGKVVARNRNKGMALAQNYGYSWQENLGESLSEELLLNVTPIGMSGGNEADCLAFDQSRVSQARLVFDVVANPSETPLIKLARALDKPVITGRDIIVLQAVEQFVLYTGTRPADELIHRASEFARLQS